MCSDLVTNSTTTIECVSFSGVFTVTHCFVLKIPIASSRIAESEFKIDGFLFLIDVSNCLKFLDFQLLGTYVLVII